MDCQSCAERTMESNIKGHACSSSEIIGQIKFSKRKQFIVHQQLRQLQLSTPIYIYLQDQNPALSRNRIPTYQQRPIHRTSLPRTACLPLPIPTNVQWTDLPKPFQLAYSRISYTVPTAATNMTTQRLARLSVVVIQDLAV